MDRYYRRRLTWESLSFWDKLSLVKLWYVVVIFGDLSLIMGIFFIIFGFDFLLGYGEVFIDIGTICIWASITKYLQNTEEFSVILRTFNKAIPLIARVWIGILPILIGIAFLSTTMMWEYRECFGDFSTTFFTMFSVQAGDALFDTYNGM